MGKFGSEKTLHLNTFHGVIHYGINLETKNKIKKLNFYLEGHFAFAWEDIAFNAHRK